MRPEIKKEYREVALHPDNDFHFHTGRRLAKIVGYRDEWLDPLPENVIASFAGTGNPFSIQTLAAGEKAAGFEDFAITWQAPVFDDAPQSSSAGKFGTVGINFKARKAGLR